MTTEQELQNITKSVNDAFDKVFHNADPRLRRQIEIARKVVEIAGKASTKLQYISRYSKKVPRIARKAPFKKRTLNQKVAFAAIGSYLDFVSLRTIISQPIPNPTFKPLPIAFIGNNPEVIIRPAQ